MTTGGFRDAYFPSLDIVGGMCDGKRGVAYGPWVASFLDFTMKGE